jgi:hypothetical protein
MHSHGSPLNSGIPSPVNGRLVNQSIKFIGICHLSPIVLEVVMYGNLCSAKSVTNSEGMSCSAQPLSQSRTFGFA